MPPNPFPEISLIRTCLNEILRMLRIPPSSIVISFQVGCPVWFLNLNQARSERLKWVVFLQVDYKKFGPAYKGRTFFFGEQIACRRRFVLNRDHHFLRRPSDVAISAAALFNTQIASNAFTFGTVTVLPFYSLMILAPAAQLVIIYFIRTLIMRFISLLI